MNEKRAPFPPGLGWAAWAAALAVVLLVSFLTASPKYKAGPTVAAPDSVTQGDNAGPLDPGATATAGPQASGGPLAPGDNGGGGGSGGTTGSQSGPKVGCSGGQNGGKTAPGVTATEVHVASTVVTTGVGAGFLGEAADGIEAAFAQANNAGGVCGRRITFEKVNSGWEAPNGLRTIQNFASSGKVFALVGQPDSEGLGAAIDNGLITRSGLPVVGTDGLLKNQYFNPWVWPVSPSTVTNMHIIAQYAVQKLGAKSFGIVYDTRYRFGAEGAAAFNNEIKRLTGKSIPGYGAGKDCKSGNKAFCGVSSDTTNYSNQINAFNTACAPCDVVVMLLEPGPMQTWMKQEQEAKKKWYGRLFGGSPLFDDKLAQNCPGCGEATMTVWTGYHPAIQPFDSEKPVATYCQALKAASPKADCHNEFTQGAYIGATLFVKALREVGARGLPLTRQNLRNVLNTTTFDTGLASGPLVYTETLPHLTNVGMAAFQENYSGSFNGWSYLNTGFLADRSRHMDLK